MAKMTAQELHNEIAAALGKLSDLFVPGMKLSFMARMPGNGEADVLVGDDNEPDEMIALINRRFSAPSSAPTAGGERQSIDTLEFAALIGKLIEAADELDDNSAYSEARAALIAHIDTWAGCSAENNRDAERFRYIEEHATTHGGGNGFTITCFVPVDEEDMGVGIDKARGAAPAPGNTAQSASKEE